MRASRDGAGLREPGRGCLLTLKTTRLSCVYSPKRWGTEMNAGWDGPGGRWWNQRLSAPSWTRPPWVFQHGTLPSSFSVDTDHCVFLLLFFCCCFFSCVICVNSWSRTESGSLNYTFIRHTWYLRWASGLFFFYVLQAVDTRQKRMQM